MLQRCEPSHLLAQHGSDAVEHQFPFLKKAVEVSTEEVGDRLRHDLEGQGIARVAGHQALPGRWRPAESLVGKQDTGDLVVHP